MQLTLNLDVPQLEQPIKYTNNILLIGSCFTEHIADRLQQHKFRILSNPHGILFNPLSVADSLDSYISGKKYAKNELFYLNELWNSWDHHTRFSCIEPETTLKNINDSQTEASEFICKADWVIITLGSAFQYYLKEEQRHVANNHRAPAQWFEKRLLSISTITESLDKVIDNLFIINPFVKVMFTISPVRHIRDGVVDNNRSKARLIEAVHELNQKYDRVSYFPAYEIVIDILRDYRFFDIDFVHPNFLATNVVWEYFVKSCISPEEHDVMKQVAELFTARNHRTRFPHTEAHKKFLKSYFEKTKALADKYPFLDLAEELGYFSGK